jgi:hypothetical protein
MRDWSIIETSRRRARIHVSLALFGGVVFGVFTQVAVRPGLCNFPRQFDVELVLLGRNLVLQFFLELFHDDEAISVYYRALQGA